MSGAYSLDLVRSELPVLQDWTYLNTGTVGAMAAPVLSAHLSNISAFELGGHTAQSDAIAGYERARQVLASFLRVAPADIAFNRNATDGINTVAAAFPLRPGDEVITSVEEHPAMVIPWLAACDRAGARLRFVNVTPDPDAFTDNLRSELSSTTRIVAMSHVSCESGIRIPVTRVRDVVGPDVAILVDASQSVGQFEFGIPDLNADFVIGNGHKWLAGPKGTGFAWFKPDSIHLAPPVYFHSETVDPHWSRSYYQTNPPPAIKISTRADRFEFGTRAWHLYGALADAIEYQASLGWSAIEAHMSTMSGHIKETLDEIPGVKVVSPERWVDSSGLVTFSIEGWTGVDASRELWDEYRIAQRRVEAPPAIRVSAAYFTSEDDVQQLVRAVDSLARNG